MEVVLDLNEYQEGILSDLLSGNMDKCQFSSMRSNARRTGNIERSLELAAVFEIYKYRIKYAKEREEPS